MMSTPRPRASESASIPPCRQTDPKRCSLPGGEPLPIRLNVKDRMEPQIITLSWHESEIHCIHSPLKAGARDSDAPSTPRSDRATNVPRRLDAAERCGSTVTLSDDTDTDLFHRPAANPHVSPTQLLPLCDSEDSDDEFFVAAQADDAEESSDGSIDVVLARGGYEPSPEARALFGLDAAYASDDEVSGNSFSKTEFWLASVSPEPSSPAAQATYQFEFVLPADAPVFPRAEALEVSSSPVRARPLAPSAAANRPLYHPRPSDDDLFETHVATLKAVEGSSDDQIHDLLLARSHAPDPHSYAQAAKNIQAQVRQLVAKHPGFRADVVTPSVGRIDWGPSEMCPFTCVFPGCLQTVAPGAAAAAEHIAARHADAARRACDCAACPGLLDCPECPASRALPVGEFGRHMFEAHRVARAVVPLHCKLCCACCVDLDAYANHFGWCAARYQAEKEPPRKRRRLDIEELLN